MKQKLRFIFQCFKIFVFLALVGLVFAACSSKEGKYFYQTNIEETNQYFEGNKNGFVLIVTDNDEHFINPVKRFAEENKVKVVMYNPYQSSGENKNNVDGSPIYPDSSDIRGNSMFYLENNKVVAELNVNNYEDSQLTNEISNFFKLYK